MRLLTLFTLHGHLIPLLGVHLVFCFPCVTQCIVTCVDTVSKTTKTGSTLRGLKRHHANVPWKALGLHGIGQCDVIGPHVKLPLVQANEAAENGAGVEPHPHVEVVARLLLDIPASGYLAVMTAPLFNSTHTLQTTPYRSRNYVLK